MDTTPTDLEASIHEALADSAAIQAQNRGDADWSPNGLTDIDWLARRIRKRRIAIDQVEELAEQYRRRIDEWVARETENLHLANSTDEAAISHWMDCHVAEGGAKTVNLPTGARIRSQAGKLSTTITDESALIAWARANQHDNWIVTKLSVARAEVGKAAGAKAAGETEPGEYPAIVDGEIVPGVSLVRGERRTYIDTDVDHIADASADTLTLAE
jgi:phage host-nuclease inhibitor protein Gam